VDLLDVEGVFLIVRRNAGLSTLSNDIEVRFFGFEWS